MTKDRLIGASLSHTHFWCDVGMLKGCVKAATVFFTTGAMGITNNSQVNFIGDVSFQGNHASDSGGKGNFEDALSAIRGA